MLKKSKLLVMMKPLQRINNNHDAIYKLTLIPDSFARHLLLLVLVPTTVLADTVIQ